MDNATNEQPTNKTDNIEWQGEGAVSKAVNKLYDNTFGALGKWWDGVCGWWYMENLRDYERQLRERQRRR